MIKQAIIPLAGLGTRLLPLTSVFAKELLPINGTITFIGLILPTFPLPNLFVTSFVLDIGFVIVYFL